VLSRLEDIELWLLVMLMAVDDDVFGILSIVILYRSSHTASSRCGLVNKFRYCCDHADTAEGQNGDVLCENFRSTPHMI